MKRVFDFFWGPADPRTYALVRITLAFTGLVNLIDLWPHRHEYFASAGLIPLDAVADVVRGKQYWSVFYWIQSESGVTAVFVVAAIALLALGAGLWTRASAALVFVWHVSFCNRAFPMLTGSDFILRIYSLFVLVSPTAKVWSVDGWLSRAPAPALPQLWGRGVPVYGLRLMQWQLFVIYLATVWLKLPDTYWRNGQLLAYFSVSIFSRTPHNLLLVRHEWLSAIGTYLSLAIEVSVPFLLAFKRTRFVGLFAGLAFHFMIGVTATIAIFSLSMVPPYMSFLDGADIDRLVGLPRRLWRPRRRRASV